MRSKKITLKAKKVWYYSPHDEDAFFEWLSKLTFVNKYFGRGATLFIEVNPKLVDEMGLRELLALFNRYSIEMRQLAVFDNEDFAPWFHNKKAYWSKKVFSESKAK